MPTQNQILKEIAVALGASVTDKDNDTNELLALIRDNIGNAGSDSSGGSSAKSYRHLVVMKVEGEYQTEGTDSMPPEYKRASVYIGVTIHTSSDSPFTTFDQVSKHLLYTAQSSNQSVKWGMFTGVTWDATDPYNDTNEISVPYLGASVYIAQHPNYTEFTIQIFNLFNNNKPYLPMISSYYPFIGSDVTCTIIGDQVESM